MAKNTWIRLLKEIKKQERQNRENFVETTKRHTYAGKKNIVFIITSIRGGRVAFKNIDPRLNYITSGYYEIGDAGTVTRLFGATVTHNELVEIVTEYSNIKGDDDSLEVLNYFELNGYNYDLGEEDSPSVIGYVMEESGNEVRNYYRRMS